MLNLSNCTITLGRSASYIRLAILIHLGAAILLLGSAFILFLKWVLLLLLLLQMLHILNNPIPHANYLKLIYKGGCWFLICKEGESLLYEKARVLIHVGLFILVELRTETRRQVMIVFMDQMTINEYRVLRIIAG